MSKKVCNEQYDFVLRNIEACNALIECHEEASDKIPTWINKKFEKSIKNNLEDIEILKFKVFYSKHKDDESVIIDPISPCCDSGNNIGLRFALESIDWYYLTDNECDYCPLVYLYMNIPGKTTAKYKKALEQYRLDVINKAGAISASAKQNGYFTGSPIGYDDDNYIIYKRLDKIINRVNLCDDYETVISDATAEIVKFVKYVIESDLLLPMP